MPDLWPDDFGTTTLLPPVSILREQAQILARKTRGLVEGHVSTTRAGENFLHEFFLVSPMLDNYTYRILFVEHPFKLYPAKITAEIIDQVFNAADSNEFIAHLGEILRSSQVAEVIQVLLAQVSDAPA